MAEPRNMDQPILAVERMPPGDIETVNDPDSSIAIPRLGHYG
jgi:hypothetical protein